MKNRYKINISFLLPLLSFVLLLNYGCSDEFFDEKSGDRISPDQHYKTLVDVEVSLGGAVAPLQDIMPRIIMLDGLRSDQMMVTENADAVFRGINMHNFSGIQQFTDPADFYKVIINLNEVLANIDKVAETDREYDSLVAWSVKGALVGMRSWTYFTLAKLYGKAAYLDGNMTQLPENIQQELMPKDQLLDKLIEDLQPYLLFGDGTTEFVEARVGGYVNNKALLGEIYLEKNDYANAVTYLKLACESYGNNPVDLKVDASFQKAAWRNLFFNAESARSENIIVIPFNSKEGQFNPLARWIGYNYEYKVKPSQILIDSILAQVPLVPADSFDIWRGYGPTLLIDTLGENNTRAYITKYAIDDTDPFSSDIVASRAADLHLKLAEALNRLGDDNSQKFALTLLNAGFKSLNPKPSAYIRWAQNIGIRGRVSLKAREVPAEITGMEKTLMIEDFIMAERALELAFEGKRWEDLVRIANRRGDAAYLADKVAAKFAGTPEYDMIRTKLLDTNTWYLPME